MLNWNRFAGGVNSVVNTAVNVVKGDTDGDDPNDTLIVRNLRDYYVAKSKRLNHQQWPVWMGPRPDNLPGQAQVSTVGVLDDGSKFIGQNYGMAQESGSNSRLQHGAGEVNGSGQQPVSTTLANVWNKPRATANAAARVGNASRNLDSLRQKSNQPKPMPRPIPSQRDSSQQARSQNQQSYSANRGSDPYSYNNQTSGTAGYESNKRLADGYGSRSATQQLPNNGYSEPRSYDQPETTSRSTPNAYRNGRLPPGGLPNNPRGNR